MKINNFAAGPSKIPKKILDEITYDINDYNNLGYSILELSHRSDLFQDMVDQVKSKIFSILNVPNNYEILLLQGGATFQNTFIPANKLSLKNNISFLISGTWSSKTFNDFEKYFNHDIPFQNFDYKNFDSLLHKVHHNNDDYLYLTSNETIEGVQFRDFEIFEQKKLIIDMSSDICSYEFNWDNISYIFAGAQKNLGIPGVTVCIFKKDFFEKNNLTSYLDSTNHLSKNSTFNTPPTFSVYVMLKVLNWINESGGIKKIEEINKIKAKKLYDYLDDNLSVFSLNAPEGFRSFSNIVFNFNDESKTSTFLDLCIKNGFIGLNGHRSVGGIRVSNYNSIELPMIEDFISFLDKFVRSKQ
jgi:phosphoserine aminotransferase